MLAAHVCTSTAGAVTGSECASSKGCMCAVLEARVLQLPSPLVLVQLCLDLCVQAVGIHTTLQQQLLEAGHSHLLGQTTRAPCTGPQYNGATLLSRTCSYLLDCIVLSHLGELLVLRAGMTVFPFPWVMCTTQGRLCSSSYAHGPCISLCSNFPSAQHSADVYGH